jgi:hypothetical protein
MGQLLTQVDVRALSAYPLLYDSRTATVTTMTVNLVSANGALTIAFLTVGREEPRVPRPVTVSRTFVSSGRKVNAPVAW